MNIDFLKKELYQSNLLELHIPKVYFISDVLWNFLLRDYLFQQLKILDNICLYHKKSATLFFQSSKRTNSTSDHFLNSRQLMLSLSLLGCEKIICIDCPIVDKFRDKDKLFMVHDHVNLTLDNPLIGVAGDFNDNIFFQDMTKVYNRESSNFQIINIAFIKNLDGTFPFKKIGVEAVFSNLLAEVILSKRLGMNIDFLVYNKNCFNIIDDFVLIYEYIGL